MFLSNCSFSWMEGLWECTKLAIFWDVKYVWPLNGLKLQPNQLLEVVLSSSASIQMDCDCKRTTLIPISPLPLLNWKPNQNAVTFTWHLLFYVTTKLFEQGKVTDVVHRICFAFFKHLFLLLSVTWTPLKLEEFLLPDI